MLTLYCAYILAFSFGGNQFAAEGNPPIKAGVEIRILEVLGPQGTTQAECEAYANAQRQRAAKDLKLPDYRALKYVCVPAALSTK